MCVFVRVCICVGVFMCLLVLLCGIDTTVNTLNTSTAASTAPTAIIIGSDLYIYMVQGGEGSHI